MRPYSCAYTAYVNVNIVLPSPMMKNILWLACCSILLFSACDKRMATADNPPDPSGPVKPGTSPIPDKQVTAGIQGLVTDENNDPVTGAQVTCGGTITITDKYGAFQLTAISMKEAAAVVTIKKSGYFNGVRTFKVTGAGKVQFVQIQLLPQTTAGEFDAATGGNITASNAQFSFMPKQVLDAANKPYTGKVSLLYAAINPERADFADIMPGDLRAVNDKNELVGLQSFGMMALELQGANGEKLHLDGINSVNFRMEIPSSLASSAPATIPLWHFDETSGLWIQEGSASKIGNNYVGTVKHFSFWNCDAQFPLINFKATLQDETGAALANTLVAISRGNGATTYGCSDNTGEVSGAIPANEQVTIVIKDKCGKIVLTKKAGPWSTDASLGIIKIQIDPINKLSFHGKVTNCDGTPVKNGLVNITVAGIHYLSYIKDGSYTASIMRCQQNTAEVILNAVDTDAGKTSTITLQLAPGDYPRDLQACSDIQSSNGSFLLEGKTTIFSSGIDTVVLRNSSYDTTTAYSAKMIRKSPAPDFVTWTFSSIALGTIRPRDFNITIGNVYYYGQSVTCNITATGKPGDYLEGTISGNVIKGADSTVVPVSGSFKFRIE